MKKFIVFTFFMQILVVQNVFAASMSIEKGASDEFSFSVGGVEDISITASGNVSVAGTITTAEPTADGHASTKTYSDTAATTPSGLIDWNDCEYFASCQGDNTPAGAVNTTLSCTAGYSIVSHACVSGGGATSTIINLSCYLSAVNSLYVAGHSANSSAIKRTCGSIKCCAVN